MSRALISAADIRKAKMAGNTELVVPANAIITPQATDMARQHGIALVDTASASPMPSAAPAPVASTPAAPAAAPAANGTTCDDFYAEVRKRVADQLPENIRNAPVVDELVRKALAEQGCECDACTAYRPEITGNCPAPANPAHDKAGEVIRVNSKALPWENFDEAPCNEVINIVDVITEKDGSPMGVGYLEWQNASFAWHLDYFEVQIVLEGELHITVGGKTLVGKPGDIFYVPKGTNLIFGSPGYVKFAYVTWPVDWATQGA